MPKVIIILIATLLPLFAARAQTKPEIDLIAGTVNGQAFAELTTDKVTDLFGRPSATTAPRVEPRRKGGDDEFPSTVVYADLGLIFCFQHPRSDPQQRMRSISIYLSQQTDEKIGPIMKPFSETLSRGINGNWKVRRVMEEFAQFSPTDAYNPEKAQETKTLVEKLKAMGVDGADLMKITMRLMACINMKTPQTIISVYYEERTKFLERIVISPVLDAAPPATQPKPGTSTEEERVIMGNTKTEVDTLLKDWSSHKSDRSNGDRSTYYYAKEVVVIIHYKDNKAVGVAVMDRPGAGVTSITQARYDELVKLIGQKPKAGDIKRDSSGIHEFSLGDTD